jgi:Uma2 family endonuclease
MSKSMLVAETAFRSDARFDQASFRRWLRRRPASDINHYELIDGRIIMNPPAGWPHARIGTTLNRLIDEHVQQHHLGIVLDSSAGYDLPSGDTVEPDVSFISAERFAAGPHPTRGKFLAIVPTLVVEILSPSTSRRDRTEKKAVYERNGVAEYWIIDSENHAVTVLSLRRRRYASARPITAGPISSRVLPRLRISVRQLFDLGV